MRILEMILGDGLRGRSIRSSLLTIFDIGTEHALRLVGNLLLTRILFPEAFGIMALVQVVMTGLGMISDLGIRMAIIQNRRGNDPLFLDTAWIMQIGRGLVLWLATFALAAPLASFYATPILSELLPVAGLIALIQGFNSTKIATTNRDLTLGRATLITIASRAIGTLVLIALSWKWENVWALVIGNLAAPLFLMIASHVALPGHTNRFRFDTTIALGLMKFGKYLFLSTLATFIILHADRAILGKFVSLTDLAMYNIALMLATIPSMLQQKLFDKVLFPLYSSRPPSESDQNYRNIARARLIVVGASMIAACIMAVTGNFLVGALYDPRYEAAGPLLVLMSLAALPNLISGGYATVVIAQGHSGRFALLVATSALIRTVSLVVGIHYFGVLGAALSPFVANLLFYPIFVWFILPYRGWIPAQDVLFSIVGCLIIFISILLNYETILSAFSFYM